MRILILKCLERGQLVNMIYMKNNGELSKRRVKVLSVEGKMFKAYCFLRNKKRTFIIDNVLAFVLVIHKEHVVV